MERFHRYYSLHRILSARRLPVPRAAIERELECSRATVNRIIDDLRGYGAPIEYLREQNGYRYSPGVAFEEELWTNSTASTNSTISCVTGARRSHATI